MSQFFSGVTMPDNEWSEIFDIENCDKSQAYDSFGDFHAELHRYYSMLNQNPATDESNMLNSEATNGEILQSSKTSKVIKKVCYYINFQKKIQTALPGESKNLHKCYGRQLQLFIRNFCNKTNNSSLKEDQHIKQFLQIQGDKIGKYELNQFLNCQKGKMFSKEFFGQCLWKYNVVKESKTSVSSLFRHNIEPFWETHKKIKSRM
ncbi:unnamed protein product (macronuclear) [Paramecium tetraurelia]|uniref:Uncharacterized protein n=1 Tax=Paramecium tetraurelia TaxID=5888 RepID=A0DXF0_PARTE|nr:uncharacterized protein GSPATT00021350001 [Paramecium tetraurelia]CAK87717.1 unnamed protein product [Paramecium tetraurelia]|eukprot:XP_001455114.1 hypothetical protein (macronuclear) [Paramecium tetraurelia strain d4-2]